MASPTPSRLTTELSLLTAMWPTQICYSPGAQDLKFTENAATLHLRLPDSYPESGFPDVISATSASKADIRAQTKSAIRDLNLVDGEEALDAVIAAFQEVAADAESARRQALDQNEGVKGDDGGRGEEGCKTVIVWLHHLLNTNKRKLALSPPSDTVCGITKPGYPGVLVYSGPASYVTEHVNTLKAQNWQAFQVRYEEGLMWDFVHGKGVREVESMSEVVKDVDCDARGKDKALTQREEFLKSVGIK